MLCRNNFKLIVFIDNLSILCFFLSVNTLQCGYLIADSNNIESNSVSYFYEPFPQEVNTSIFQIGGLFTFVPIPLIENEYPIPSVDFQYKRGVFNNVSFDTRFTTNVYSNILHTGFQYNFNIYRLSFGLSNHLGLFAGFLTYEEQFVNNWAYSIFYLPTLRFGYRFDGFSVSSSFAGIYLLKTVSKVGNYKLINIDNQWNDFFFTFAIEQPFIKKQHISIGFSILYTRTPYQAWMLYNTIDEYLIEPEFFFAFQL